MPYEDTKETTFTGALEVKTPKKQVAETVWSTAAERKHVHREGAMETTCTEEALGTQKAKTCGTRVPG